MPLSHIRSALARAKVSRLSGVRAATARSRRALWEWLEGPSSRVGLPPQLRDEGGAHEGAPFGTLATSAARSDTTAYLGPLLGFAEVLYAPTLGQLREADAYCQWAIRPSRRKTRLAHQAGKLGIPALLIEDGLLLRSLDIGLSGTPALSIMFDHQTAHYDATRPSLLEQTIASGELGRAERERARACIEELRRARLSKYNHAPDRRISYGPRSQRKVLVVDQRYGDGSVPFGLASTGSFEEMLRFALSERPRHHVLLKRHPDAIKGGRDSYFSDHRLRAVRELERVTVIDHDTNPHTLFDQVEEVFVVSSGMGFEAVLAGLPVHCFGAPFYSGWGCTEDRVRVPRRGLPRSPESLFHAACIRLARYYRPDVGRPVSIENQLDWFAGTLRTAASPG